MIVCENLVKIHQVDNLEVVALQGLDLEVAKGEFLAIVGASGSGKSTLLNILGGLDRPSAGRVTVAGQDLLKLSDQALARYRLKQVGFVWQQASRNLLPYLTAQENVELPMLAAGGGSRDTLSPAQYACELLEEVGLTGRRHHRLAQLSGGQQQRVAIAVALANRPQLLLADEPTGEVDSATAQLIWRLLRQLGERYGLTTVVVTHDPAIASVVDRVIAIRDGKTSTETVRHSQSPLSPSTQTATWKSPPDQGSPAHHAEQFEERALLDMAGRVQIPREYLERRGIKTRAVVQLVEDGILLRPAGDEAREDALVQPAEVDSLFATNAQDPLPPRRHPWWRRLLGSPAHRRAISPGEGETGEPGEIARGFPQSAASALQDETLVQAVGLRRVYQVGDETVQALQGVDLTIARQRFVVFRGRSGSGKTTLLNLLGGLDQPTAGRVILFGQDLQALSDMERTRLRQERIGFVFQAFSLMPAFSALENVEMLLRAAQIEEEARRARALHCLTLVGLRRWADHRPFEMSGGQQQRLSIARALALRPELIIADEPTSNLDSETGKQILHLFQQLVEEAGVTVLMASHDPASDSFATDIYELHDGRIVARP